MGHHRQGHHHQQHHQHQGSSGRPGCCDEGSRTGFHRQEDVPPEEPTPAAVIAPVEKLTKMLQHWLHHNEDHARSFSDWAGRALGLGRADVAEFLEEAARLSRAQNELFQKALELLESTPREPA